MKTKKLFLFILLFFFKTNIANTCSCEVEFFCDYIKEEQVKIAFQAKIIHHVDYGPNSLAAYLEIIKRYKDEISLPDTIKLYGQHSEAGCAIDLFQYDIGDTLIWAINTSGEYDEIVNPDSLTENYWEFFPGLCSTVRLRTINGKVFGRINKGIGNGGYPLELFESHLIDCDFIDLDAIESGCGDNLIVYPNPSITGNIFIRREQPNLKIQKIRLFHIDGKLIEERAGLESGFYNSIPLRGIRNGVHILEITCDEGVYYEMIIMHGR